jgi:AraC family transcriptional regulator, transcriptional activator of the genes for pyochelin and ferripyochelin receptors
MPPFNRAADVGATFAERIQVSTELTTLIGGATADRAALSGMFGLGFSLGTGESQPTLQLNPVDGGERVDVVLLVDRAALERLGGQALIGSNQSCFHLPSELRAIVLMLCNSPAQGEARTAYRLAKSIELVCETVRLFESGRMVVAVCEGLCSEADGRRLAAARRMIDERWNEKLTLDQIARACGLNRAKLTRGFREMFNCSIAEALAERRLLEARRLLLTTDLPVSSVGYESGYLNNASFSRAFGRHFGRSPSDYRAVGVAA